jgi:hypothetical protein
VKEFDVERMGYSNFGRQKECHFTTWDTQVVVQEKETDHSFTSTFTRDVFAPSELSKFHDLLTTHSEWWETQKDVHSTASTTSKKGSREYVRLG